MNPKLRQVGMSMSVAEAWAAEMSRLAALWRPPSGLVVVKPHKDMDCWSPVNLAFWWPALNKTLSEPLLLLELTWPPPSWFLWSKA